MHHYASQLVDLACRRVDGASHQFFIDAYFAGLKYPVSESVFGRVVVHNDVDLAPHIVGALILSLIGHLWSRFRVKLRE
jgi:hypothetical protein